MANKPHISKGMFCIEIPADVVLTSESRAILEFSDSDRCEMKLVEERTYQVAIPQHSGVYAEAQLLVDGHVVEQGFILIETIRGFPATKHGQEIKFYQTEAEIQNAIKALRVKSHEGMSKF